MYMNIRNICICMRAYIKEHCQIFVYICNMSSGCQFSLCSGNMFTHSFYWSCLELNTVWWLRLHYQHTFVNPESCLTATQSARTRQRSVWPSARVHPPSQKNSTVTEMPMSPFFLSAPPLPDQNTGCKIFRIILLCSSLVPVIFFLVLHFTNYVCLFPCFCNFHNFIIFFPEDGAIQNNLMGRDGKCKWSTMQIRDFSVYKVSDILPEKYLHKT